MSLSAWTSLGVLLVAGCGSAPSSPSRPPLEDRDLSADEKHELVRLEGMFRAANPDYERERQRVLAQHPKLAPWVAKALVGYAVGDLDRLQQRGIAPERVESAEDFRDRTFFRARTELVALQDAGRHAIARYLLEARQGQLRDLGRYLLLAHPREAVLALAEGELTVGNDASKREALRLLGEVADREHGLPTLARMAADPDWRLRGTAVRAYGTASGRIVVPEAADWLWRVYRADGDSFVRQQALLGLGDLEDPDQIRPLVDELEILVGKGRGPEAKAAGEALERLTGRSHGVSVQSWRTWLGGR